MKIQYKTMQIMYDAIEKTLNIWAKEDWILVQILAFPGDMMVTIVMEKN